MDDFEDHMPVDIRLSEAHCQGDPMNLLDPSEKEWLVLAPVLELHGYRLGGRLAPGWIPAWWKDTDLCPWHEADWENSNVRFSPRVQQNLWLITPQQGDDTRDAHRSSDGQVVVIKRVFLNNTPNEVGIGLFLNSPALRRDPSNHTVPILDTFSHPMDPGLHFIVMPFLRHFNDPPFSRVEEVLEFIDHFLEVRL